jgi:hypothetical protein
MMFDPEKSRVALLNQFGHDARDNQKRLTGELLRENAVK